MEFEWTGELTGNEPGKALSWRSIEGSEVDTGGTVRFMPERGGTRLDVQLSYSPPAGVLGHALALLFGDDPKHALDDDLLRFKSLLEAGKATGHSGTASREELGPDTGV